MTTIGKTAVRKAFEHCSGSQWPTVRDEYIATRVQGLYNPFKVDDLDIGGLALDLVRRAYLNGLREAQKSQTSDRASCAQREAAATAQLLQMFDRDANPEWITDAERVYVESSIREAFRAGCTEGQLPIGTVI